MRRYILREEGPGTGYLFDRLTGTATFISGAEFQRQKTEVDLFFIPAATTSPERARTAPFCVWFELTRQCNLSCLYCGAPPVEGDKNPLTLRKISRIFDDMAACGVFEIRFTGGEPTMHPEFCNIVELAANYGFYVSLNSNGCMPDEVRQELATLPIGLYIISLDGPKIANDQLRPDSYDDAITMIQTLTNAGKHVRINTVLCKANKDHLETLVTELQQLEVEGLTLVPLRPAGQAKDDFYLKALTRHEYGQILREIRRLRETHAFNIAASYDTMSGKDVFNTGKHFTKRCVAGVEGACLAPNGDLRACILMNDPEHTVGNLTKTPFTALWAKDDLWGRFRNEESLSDHCRNCDHFAKQCPGTCHVICSHLGSPEMDPYCQRPH